MLNISEDNFKGAWVFISHSNKDFAKVRRVRNEFEETGHRPILFFLKSMDDDLDRALYLIKREIDAREWFMLCDSENAKDSKIVQEEVKYIESLKDKVNERLDLRAPWEEQKKKIHALAIRSTVFISFSARDGEIAKEIAKKLLEQGFGVFDPHSLESGNDYLSRISVEISEAVKRGFFLILLSPEAIKSKFVKHELDFALKIKMQQDSKASNILPIIVRNSQEVYDGLPNILSLMEIQNFDFTKGSFIDNMAKLIEYLKTVKLD